MLRPNQMSRISITGSKAVMDDVIEELHRLNLVHLSDYDGDWEGFDSGEPLSGGDEVSERLVQVRAIENILGLDEEDSIQSGNSPSIFRDTENFEEREDEIYDRLEDIRQRVNELEDERNELRDDLREVRDQIRSIEPFVDLGIPLELLRGYESIQLVVGETQEREVINEELENSDEVGEFELFGDRFVAIAAETQSDDPDFSITDVLVGVDFTQIEVPDAEGEPGQLIDELRARENSLESDIEEIESKKDEIKSEAASFLLAAEEDLSIEADRSEAPLRFATTVNSFYAEGWIPTNETERMEENVRDSVGERVDIQVLETVDYDQDGFPEAEEYGEDEEDPPVLQDNPEPVKPFELLVNTVNRPKYSEIDPTFVVFLTFPMAYGFMIGDLGYGLLYMAMGYVVIQSNSEAMKALGWITIWAGAFTALFGYLYDDFLGVHMHDFGIALPLTGVLDKGLHTTEVAQLWIIISILFGIVHLNTGFIIGFINEIHHSVKESILEYLSWIVVLNGLFIWVFSTSGSGTKPSFLVGRESVLYENPVFGEIGFAGLPEAVGLAGLGFAGIGIVMVYLGEGGIGLIEIPTNALGHVLSYLRIVAVLLAKGGMAFSVNLFVFGAYESHGHVKFRLPGTEYAAVPEAAEMIFGGILWAGIDAPLYMMIIAFVGAILVFVLGHVMVLLLGITAAGIQMVRLEYVEFFGKFYEGGGRNFEPFGRPREYTKEGN